MNKELDSSTLTLRPTRVRFGVLGFACSLSMVSYLDRVCISKAVPDIQKVLGLDSEADLNLALTAFAISYAAFEIPSGWLGDVFGPRNVLIRIVLWWSFFTALTGLVGLPLGPIVFGFWMLVAVRFLFGMGEAGTYPNITRALHNWFPFSKRGMAQGTVWMSGRLMGGLTPMFWVLLTAGLGLKWRELFFVFGGVGIIWCVLFYIFFRNRPDEHPSVNEAEIALIHEGRHGIEQGHAHVPWGKMFASRNLWALCLMYFLASYGWYFNITYLPTYLGKQIGMQDDPVANLLIRASGADAPAEPDIESTTGADRIRNVVLAVYQGGPLWLGALACIVGGLLTDRFIRLTGDRKWGRRRFGIVGHSLSAVCLFCAVFAPNAFTSFLAFSFAAFFNDLTMGAAWSVCQDIGKGYAAIVAGCMNTIGNLGGAASVWLTGKITGLALQSYAAARGFEVSQLTEAQKRAGLQPGYMISISLLALAYVIAVAFWFRIDSTEPVIHENPEAALPAN
jgi:MFS family permease